MSERAKDTPQHNQSQTAKPGAAQPPSTAGSTDSGKIDPSKIPEPSAEPFLMINVCPGATREQIVAAVDEALRTIDNPFFQYDAPIVHQARSAKLAESGVESDPIPRGKALMMLVRQEGW